MGIHFDHLGILTHTDDENAAMAGFFTDVLDLPVEGDAARGYAEVQAGGMTISLHRGALIDDFGTHGGTLLQCRCDDVDAEVEQIRSRGGDIAVEPVTTDWGTRSAYVKGPYGLLVELYSGS